MKKDNLTILLLVKGRDLYTLRWLFYANQIKFPYYIYIADGGKDSKINQIVKNKKNFPNINYEYVKYPFDLTSKEFYSKVLHALQITSTPFVALASNDDFFFIDGLERALNFLQQNSEYVASCGNVYDMYMYPCEQLGDFNKVYGKIELKQKVYPAMNIENSTSIERLETFMFKCFNSFLWQAVYRTKALMIFYQKLFESCITDLRFGDFLIYSMTVASGKIKKTSNFYALHQSNPTESLGLEIIKKNPTWLDWIQNKSWINEFNNVAKYIAEVISYCDNITLEQANKRFKRIYLSLFGEVIIRIYYPKFKIYDIKNDCDIESLKNYDEYKNISSFLQKVPK